MHTITLAEFEADPQEVVAHVRAGEGVVVTENGQPLLHIVPTEESTNSTETPDEVADPFYSIHELAALWNPQPGETPLNHSDIDKIVYGHGDEA
jgi:prevent-host-death family protein